MRENRQAIGMAESTLLEIRGIQLHRHRKARAALHFRFTHTVNQQAGTVFQRAAPVIFAAVGERRQE